MSMSEIQEAAEIITSAVSPDANIIFGATLKPELEDELIITVIATGFDSAYYHQQATPSLAGSSLSQDAAQDNTVDEAVGNIDMNLNHTDAAEHFASDTDHNIWNQPQEQDEDDTPAFCVDEKT